MIDVNSIIDWIKDYFVSSKGEKAVIGISGGKDSTVTLALLCKAIGPENVIAVKMPCGEQKDIADSNEIIEYFNILDENIYECNIEATCENMYDELEFNAIRVDKAIITNLPARVRMTFLYAIASQCNGRVVSTGNFSESLVGYTTKFGDGAGDFAVLANYTVREIKEIGMILQVPPKWLERTPSDGMSEMSDEKNLGFSYDTLDALIMDDIRPDIDTYNKIISKYYANRHKFINIPKCPWYDISDKGKHRSSSLRWVSCLHGDGYYEF